MIRAVGIGYAAIALLWLAASAAANGGALRLNRAAAGPYLISVWIQPDHPRVGGVDVSVAVMKPATGAPVLDAAAELRAQRGDSQGVSTVRLERGGGGNLLLYHGNLDVPNAGQWRVLVAVAGRDGTGDVGFDLDVGPPRSWTGPALAAVAAAVVGGFGSWIWRRRRSGGRRSSGSPVVLAFALSMAHGASGGAEPLVLDVQLKECVLMLPRVLVVEQSDEVTLRWSSNHRMPARLLGYDLEESVAPGTTTTTTFRAMSPSRFEITTLDGIAPGETHPWRARSSTTIERRVRSRGDLRREQG